LCSNNNHIKLNIEIAINFLQNRQ